jgi:uncharacterized integral membrane protein
MQRKLIFLLVFMVLVAIFAIQNSAIVEIKLWFWSVKTSMALILILTFAVGAIAGILFSLLGRSENRRKEPQVKTPEQKSQTGPKQETQHGKMDEFEDVHR